MGRGVHKSPFDMGVIQNTLDFFGIKLGGLRASKVDWTKQFSVPGAGGRGDLEAESLIRACEMFYNDRTLPGATDARQKKALLDGGDRMDLAA